MSLADLAKKYFDEHEPEGECWERNIYVGDKGWERFDYHEEAYWMKLKEECNASE